MKIKNYVVGFVFDEDRNTVLLIEKLKPEWQAGYLNGIGGKIEDCDRSPNHAMRRECHEETGLEIPPIYWHRVGVMKRAEDFETHVFYATWRHTDQAKSMEAEQVGVYSLYDVLRGAEKTLHNIPALIQFCKMHCEGEAAHVPSMTLTYSEVEPMGET